MAHDERLRRIKALLFDVDGILTDNGLYVGEDGTTFKKFCILDGAGIKLAQMAGLKTGLISGHSSQATLQRARALGMEICEIGVKDKVPVFESVLRRLDLNAEEVSFMGDDFMDAPLLRRAGFAATVPEAPPQIRDLCHFVSARPGGKGAVRDMIEHVLEGQGQLESLLKRFL